MPKRSNEFQRLVRLIETALAPDCGITESAMLTDSSTGEEREVDIVIRGRIGSRDLLIAVECTARRRPASVEWVEQTIAKHSVLPTDVLILVSKSGFTPQASNKGDQKNVRLVTMKEAIRADWKSLVGSLQRVCLDRIDARPVWCNAVLVEPTGREVKVPPNLPVYREGQANLGTVKDIVERVLRHRTFVPHAYRKLGAAHDADLPLEIEVPKNTYVVDSADRRHFIRCLRFSIRIERATSVVELNQCQYGKHHIAHAVQETVLGHSQLVLAESEGRKLVAVLALLEADGRIKSIHPMTSGEGSSGRV